MIGGINLTVNCMPKILARCAWVPEGDTLYEMYHDTEWGVPVHDDRKMFEFLVLESAQAGLSWRTILGRREGYRKAFADFDPVKVARFSEKKVEKLMQNPGIIRNRQKIVATVRNAKAFLAIQKEYGSFCAYLWNWVTNKPIQGKRKTIRDIPALTPLSEMISKDLKKRGFSFLGPTVCYAHLQATGLVNDHTRDCFRFRALR